MKNLFGDEIPEEPDPRPKSKYQGWKLINNYRASSGERQCQNCKFARKRNYHNKNYYKCILLGTSYSTATDIRLKDVCNLHQYDIPGGR